jgi:hypothetical protein
LRILLSLFLWITIFVDIDASTPITSKFEHIILKFFALINITPISNPYQIEN